MGSGEKQKRKVYDKHTNCGEFYFGGISYGD